MLEFLLQISRYLPKDVPRKVGPYVITSRDSRPDETTIACKITEVKLGK